MEAIWPGSSSFSPGDTPYGFYDNEAQFNGSGVHSVDRFADWAAKRLGYPIVAIELQDKQFYACYEEAVTEYSAQVNQFNIKDNLLSMQGQSTGSSVTHKKTTPTFGRTIQLSEQYGSEAGVGGTISYKTGSINIVSGSQQYDLNKLWANVSESSKAIEIRKVHYEASPAVTRYYDPYAGTGDGSYNMLDSFGWGNNSPAISFMMMPIYADLLKVQAIEFNDQIRKSAYSFELTNNNLRIFPKPTENYKLHFKYILKEDRDNTLQGTTDGVVSDFSNAPYDNMKYQFINDVGKQWIRKYALALCKELLGSIRSKYASLPIPNAETTLDGDTLRSEATAEKETLVTQLREMLEQTSRKALLEADKDEAQHLQEKLQKVPYPIYIG
jgi:acylphosphatase|tara:strand:+ start:241 stop:1392 length:1152 start_codon:yes stop_codon:yes gene_type:complete